MGCCILFSYDIHEMYNDIRLSEILGCYGRECLLGCDTE